MLDQFIRVVFPTVRLPKMWYIRPLWHKQDLSVLFVQRRVMSCFLQRVSSDVGPS